MIRHHMAPIYETTQRHIAEYCTLHKSPLVNHESHTDMFLLQFSSMDGPFKEEIKACDVPQDPLQLPIPLDDPPSPVMVKRNRSELANTYELKSQLSEPGFIAAPVSCFSHVSYTTGVLIHLYPSYKTCGLFHVKSAQLTTS
jgi:hypothetical protein